MSTINQVNNFEISIEKDYNRNDIVYLILKINNLNYFRFPYFLVNVENVLIQSFEHIINGKDSVIDLNLDIKNYNLLIFNKEYFTISLLGKDDNLNQECRIVFENNSIVRNALRIFIYNN
jgi:hypothetical protein